MVEKIDRKEILELLRDKAWLFLPIENDGIGFINCVDTNNSLIKTFAIILRKQDEIIDKLNELVKNERQN